MTFLNKHLKLAKKIKKRQLFFVLTCLILANIALTSKPAMADESDKGDFAEYKLDLSVLTSYKDEFIKMLNPEVLLFEKNNPVRNYLPENEDSKVAYTTKIVFTAYNSEVGQCDDSPCITANGFNVCKHDKEDTIAMNGIKMGTKIRIPDLFGDRVFVVRDRMNARYDSSRADIWMKDKTAARQFGVKVAKVEILK
jgi:3D (Asp-Asp-Asp) domain-containing protein